MVFSFMLHSFHEETLLKERTEKLKFYHDTLYLGFTALDSATNSECSRKYSSGWWYPYALHMNLDTKYIKESCTHHPFSGTNLNGVFDYLNPNLTTRRIMFCEKEDVNQCVMPKYHDSMICNFGKCLIGWNYRNIHTFKLKTTQMWLGKKTTNSIKNNDDYTDNIESSDFYSYRVQ